MATHAERLKTHHAAVMRTLHGEIRRHPGGYVEIARETGRPVQTLINMFNPHSMDTAPPADLLLDVIEIVQARATVNVIAGGLGAMLSPVPESVPAESDSAAFQHLVGEAGDVLSAGTKSLSDGRFDAHERVEMARELDELIAAAAAMRRRLRR